MQKWEYAIKFVDEWREDWLNRFGNNEWELVAIDKDAAIFKRPIIDYEAQAAHEASLQKKVEDTIRASL